MWGKSDNSNLLIWDAKHSEIDPQLDRTLSKHPATIGILLVAQNHANYNVQIQFHSSNFSRHQPMNWFEYSYLNQAITESSRTNITICHLFTLPRNSVTIVWTTLVRISQIHSRILLMTQMIADRSSLNRFRALFWGWQRVWSQYWVWPISSARKGKVFFQFHFRFILDRFQVTRVPCSSPSPLQLLYFWVLIKVLQRSLLKRSR